MGESKPSWLQTGVTEIAVRAQERRARRLLLQGDLDGAIAAYDQIIGLDPDHAEAHYQLGLCYRQQRRWDDAVHAFSRAQELGRALDFAAADFLGCAPEQLIRDGERYIGPNEEPLAFETVVDHARAMGLQLSAQGRWQVRPIEWDFERGTGEPYFAYVFGAQVAEVEVNRRTGRTRVRKIWAAHDAGTILYPQGAMGQMYGGIAQGLGYALSEVFRYVDGMPQQLDFDRYRIPRARDVPEIEGTYIQTRHSEGPYGAKNLAEPVMIATAPAIANAYAHATGDRVRELPLPKRPLDDTSS